MNQTQARENAIAALNLYLDFIPRNSANAAHRIDVKTFIQMLEGD